MRRLSELDSRRNSAIFELANRILRHLHWAGLVSDFGRRILLVGRIPACSGARGRCRGGPGVIARVRVVVAIVGVAMAMAVTIVAMAVTMTGIIVAGFNGGSSDGQSSAEQGSHFKFSSFKFKRPAS